MKMKICSLTSKTALHLSPTKVAIGICAPSLKPALKAHFWWSLLSPASTPSKSDGSELGGTVLGVVLFFSLLIWISTSVPKSNAINSTSTPAYHHVVAHPTPSVHIDAPPSTTQEITDEAQPKKDPLVPDATAPILTKESLTDTNPEYLDHDQVLPPTADTEPSESEPQMQHEAPATPIKEIQNFRAVAVPEELTPSDTHSDTSNEITRRLSAFTAQ